MESNQQSLLCRMGCGFFGSAAMEGMCSKCFRENQMRKSKEQQNSPSTGAPSSSTPVRDLLPATPSGNTLSTSSSLPHSSPSPFSPLSSHGATPMDTEGPGVCDSVSVSATPLSRLTTPPSFSVSSDGPVVSRKSPTKNRCFVCRKKVGLTGFDCRCGHLFCALHRYVDKHQCPFDYKSAGREELMKKHPKIVAEKIQKL